MVCAALTGLVWRPKCNRMGSRLGGRSFGLQLDYRADDLGKQVSRHGDVRQLKRGERPWLANFAPVLLNAAAIGLAGQEAPTSMSRPVDRVLALLGVPSRPAAPIAMGPGLPRSGSVC